jgi:hypothetical protein
MFGTKRWLAIVGRLYLASDWRREVDLDRVQVSIGGVEPGWGWPSPSVPASSLKSEGWLMTRASWTVLVETRQADGTTARIEIATLERDISSPTAADLGLRLAEAKDLLLKLQSFFAQDQLRRMSAVDQTCR